LALFRYEGSENIDNRDQNVNLHQEGYISNKSLAIKKGDFCQSLKIIGPLTFSITTLSIKDFFVILNKNAL
jgi:hypothetical protein